MNNQQAIDELKSQIFTLECMIAYNADFESEIDNSNLERRMETAKIAVSALEKQTKKEPVCFACYTDGTRFAGCPRCRSMISSDQFYCKKCGQAIDWSWKNI